MRSNKYLEAEMYLKYKVHQSRYKKNTAAADLLEPYFCIRY